MSTKSNKMSLRRRKATHFPDSDDDDVVSKQENTPVKSAISPRYSPPKISKYDHNELLSTPKTCSPKSPRTIEARKSPIKAARNFAPVQLFKNNVSPYQELKDSLHTEATALMPCRNKEMEFMSTFLQDTLLNDTPASLYISGAPGAGKSACLSQIIDSIIYKYKKPFGQVHVNCMSVRTASAIYQIIWEKCGLGSFPKSKTTVIKQLQAFITSPGDMMLLVLDEIDQLDSRNQEVLYTLFELPALENSRAVLIGIANAMDLTHRCLPRLHVSSKYQPKLLHYPPYTKDDIITIINSRIEPLSSSAKLLLTPSAILCCARKVSSLSGDARKALEICRRAVEIAETAADNGRHVLMARGNDGLNVGSPQKSPSKLNLQKPVDVAQIMSVINTIYGNNFVGNDNNCESSLPLHQKLLLCSLLLAVQNIKSKQVTVSKLQEIYTRVCKRKLLDHVDQSEFLNLCSLVETRGLLQLKRRQELRQSNVLLRVDAKEVEYALQDRTLLASILQDASLTIRKIAL